MVTKKTGPSPATPNELPATSSGPAAPEPIAPNLTAEPTEAEKEAWRRSSGRDAPALALDHDTALLRMTAMALVDYHANGGKESGPYFDGILSSMKLVVAGNKMMMAVATVASGWDRQDTKEGNSARKHLDALASAIEGANILASELKLSLSYTAQCVEDLIREMKARGGYRKVANLARNEDIEQSQRGVIALDSGKARDIALKKARDLLGDISGNDLALVGTNVRLDRAVVEEAMIRQDLDDGMVRRLYVLTRATDLITQQPTGKQVDASADPKGTAGKKPAMRVTEPHLLYRPDGSYLLSGHMALAGNVVSITGLGEALEDGTDSDLMMPPQVHRKLALNLADAKRRNVLLIEQGEPAAGTQNVVATYRMRSDAATHSSYLPSGPGLSFSWLKPTYGKKDADDTIRTVRADRSFNLVASLPAFVPSDPRQGFMAEIARKSDLLAVAARKDRAIDCRVQADANGTCYLAIAVEKGNDISMTVGDGATPCRFKLPAADLLAWLSFAKNAGLPDQVIAFSLDAKAAAVRWDFVLADAQWQLFMPTTGEAGVRLTDAFERIELQQADRKAA